jgi:adenylate cyclase
VGEVYPGVETHANVIAGMLDGKVLVKPDYAVGYEFVLLTLAGLLLAIALPTLSATMAILLSVGVAGFLLFLNFWLYLQWGLVLPLATSLVMVGTAFALNMSYGYFVESRSKRELANLFSTYVPPELVDEMVKQPDKYSMQATDKELTVMFSDMRGFTHMSETMEPTQLQRLLNHVFSRLTHLIRSDKGTIDKYMGDCVMAFWGAPVETPDHAQLAVRTALAMTDAIHEINAEHQKQGLPSIGMGVGLNTGQMCVGDMGSDIRRSYTVIGDAVNLGSRLEGLCKAYTVEIVASDSTRRQTRGFVWQELDLVKVKGKDEAVAIFTPLGTEDEVSAELKEELALWGRFLAAYRSQQWGEAETMMVNLLGRQPDKPLYRLYDGRLAEKKQLPYDPDWDGSTQFETK